MRPVTSTTRGHVVLLPVLLAVAASSSAGGGAERGRNPDGGSGGAVGEGGAGGFGEDCGPVDFTSDPRNCGTCGHDCLGGACEVFACQPYVVAQFAQGSIDGLTSHGDSILIAAELPGPNGFQDGIYRLPIAGGAPTLLAETGDNQDTRMATDDTHLYWTSSSTPQDQLLATDLSSGQTEVLAAAAWSDVARVGQRLFFYDGTAIQAFDLTTKEITTVAPTSYEDFFEANAAAWGPSELAAWKRLRKQLLSSGIAGLRIEHTHGGRPKIVITGTPLGDVMVFNARARPAELADHLHTLLSGRFRNDQEGKEAVEHFRRALRGLDGAYASDTGRVRVPVATFTERSADVLAQLKRFAASLDRR